jgi:CheY-like chemotaxis protein
MQRKQIPSPALNRSTSPPRRRVLVVEDNAELRSSISLVLELDGAVVSHAGSVAEAREQLQTPPDLLLLDVHLGEETSHRLAEEVLTTPSPPAVVIMSGAATNSERQRFTALGIERFLWKPFTPEDLATLVRELLGDVAPT